VRRLVLGFILCALLAVPSLASAAPPIGGCPPGFNPMLTINIPGYGTFYGYQSADLNGDGTSCVRFLPNSPTELVFMDNVVPTA
jgi:hypothetical protein